ncbi:MAG: type III-A CRISPR-associated RAMP protein Csm3 [Ignisphaera sp.]|uniref:type III-A CRISPR-associated RAMP protein Csm3 n=1 Tax=Thermoprotei TaxID=183924 RepID=UPI00316825FC
MSARNKVFERQLTGYATFNLQFETKIGLLIQAPIQAQAYRIGGADKYHITTKIRYSDTELEVPYIPGSSIKGRLRALLEIATNQNLYTTDKKIWQYTRSLRAMSIDEFIKDIRERNPISELFGWAAANFKQIVDELKKEKSMGDQQAEEEVYKAFQLLSITRLLFSDFYPTPDYVKKNRITSVDDFLERKPENRIDRYTAAADPREIVRVRPGVEFEGVVNMLLFDHDKNMISKYLEIFVTGLELLEATYLGSSGSRGYGRIRFTGKSVKVLKINPRNIESGRMISEVSTIEFKNLQDLRTQLEKLKEALQNLYT